MGEPYHYKNTSIYSFQRKLSIKFCNLVRLTLSFILRLLAMFKEVYHWYKATEASGADPEDWRVEFGKVGFEYRINRNRIQA
jgi:hypothetical protein